ncbi:phage tail sheath family protein [Mesobacterium pallidum]|uniref:phage tail sheath family protein n=1 Tax=Mesobacterium pallidum TaxID=2872037 RepID=UPI001EE180C6|nr:phage tail sheath C-terminal domain-containing protein [Mesobacterium pallidum]
MYQHPGVYIEHVPSGALSIEAASTSVTAFIGKVDRGVPVNGDGAPVFISSVGQYATLFGPVGGGPGGVKNNGSDADPFGLAVNAYFSNGGTKAYIVPVATNAAKESTGELKVKLGAKNYKVTVTANSPGKWADTLLVEMRDAGVDSLVTLVIGTQTAESLGENDVAKKAFEDELEVITGLSLDPDSPAFAEARVGAASTMITIKVVEEAGGAALPVRAALKDGVDSGSPGKAAYSSALEKLKDYRDVSIIVLPGKTWQDDKTTYEEAITHAEFMQNRMVIVDGNGTALNTPKDVKDQGFPTSPYSAFYYPQMTVQNPHYDPDLAGNLPKTFNIGPAPFAAGIWGRIDGTRGVWKAPAGLEASVRGGLGPTVVIGNALQDNLNEWGVNCLRAIIGPTVVWGARTLATKAKPQYRYVPVRRTQNMIGESLYRALQAVVFEPNDHKLWGSLRASVGDFMNGLFRAGAFQGEKASDAYFVNCGLGSTMTQGDIDAGIVRVAVGFAPLKPAEFVVVQIQQKVGQAS